jgi:periplasmic divalent cation tolerance protein
MDACFVYVTVSDEAEAKTIARTVVNERLAACANLLGPIQSVYWWDGKVCDGTEAAVVLKTSADRQDELIERIRSLHSYECPCMVCLPIAAGNADFLSWIVAETARRD